MPAEAADTVERYLRSLPPATRELVDAVRDIIRQSHPGLTEHIKWNAPSFCHRGEDRITMGIERKGGVRIVLHRGARATDNADFAFPDPEGLARWPAPDRGVILIADRAVAAQQRDAMTALFRRWIEATAALP